MGFYLSCAPEEISSSSSSGFFAWSKTLEISDIDKMVNNVQKIYTCHSLLGGCLGKASEEKKREILNKKKRRKKRSTAEATGENVTKKIDGGSLRNYGFFFGSGKLSDRHTNVDTP